MDITINTRELQAALGRAQGVASTKSTMPILSCVLLTAEQSPAGGRLHIRAYDMEVALTAELPCEVKKEGAVAVPAKALHDIVKAAPELSVRLKLGANNRLEVTSGDAQFRLAGMAAEDFPTMPTPLDAGYVAVPSTLADSIGKVAFAMSTDETRYNLNGVFVEADKNGLVLVATDGHRLAMTVDAGEAPKMKAGAIIGKKALGEFRKLVTDGAASAEWACDGTSLAYRRQGLSFTARLVDGQFPDFRQVVPELGESPVAVVRGQLLEVLKRVMLMSDAGVAVAFEDGRMTITARNPEVGDASDTVSVTGDCALKLTLNGHYLGEALASMSSPGVAMHFNDEMSPVVLHPSADESHVCVIMPMRG